MKLNTKKLKISLVVGTVMSIVALLLFFISTVITSLNTNNSPRTSSVEFLTDAVASDPTKLDVDSWVITLMEVSMYVIIGLLSLGILVYSIYILGHFIKRRFVTLSAEVSEQVEEHEENPNLVKLSLEEEVENEKSN